MALSWALGFFGMGLVLVVASAEGLVESTAVLSRRAGVSGFLLSVVLLGFDAENLAVGTAASADQAAGLALGTIVGAAMVALALALGITALIAPLSFQRVPRRVLGLPVGASLLLLALAADGQLSRFDGALLFASYLGALAALVRWERAGIRVVPRGVVPGGVVPGDADDDASASGAASGSEPTWTAALGAGLAVVGVVVGSELLLRGARPLIAALGWTDTLFGMTVLALLVSVEEVARELPAALKGRPDISIGNVVGSALAFFGCNAGLIALARPVPVADITRWFYLPVCAGTVVLTAVLLATRRVPRWGGVLLLLTYALFAVGPLVA
jgi:cation:H+ antiporter